MLKLCQTSDKSMELQAKETVKRARNKQIIICNLPNQTNFECEFENIFNRPLCHFRQYLLLENKKITLNGPDWPIIYSHSNSLR